MRAVSGASLPPITMKFVAVVVALAVPPTCAAIRFARLALPETTDAPGFTQSNPCRNGSG
jgi:hypothetical protein